MNLLIRGARHEGLVMTTGCSGNRRGAAIDASHNRYFLPLCFSGR
jgi:hypothetical protein